MSNSLRQPKLARTSEFAWPAGDQPGELVFAQAVARQLADRIFAALRGRLPGIDGPGVAITALATVTGVLGRFRLVTGAGVWFVRISARWGEPELEQALAGFLRERGVGVNWIEIAGLPFSHDGHDFRLDARPFLDARHFNGSDADLLALATTLTNCHRALRDFPRASEIRALAAVRFAGLSDTLNAMRTAHAAQRWDFFAADSAWAEKRADWLGEMIAGFTPRLDLAEDAQCVHSQIHRGNVVFLLATGAPVLLDFEESIHTFVPPAWDSAHLVQRFCLHDSPTQAVLAARLEVIIAGCKAPLGALATMMRQCAWLSIAILVRDHSVEGAGAPVAEYEKFVAFERQAATHATLLGG
jgi:hypothetical protein